MGVRLYALLHKTNTQELISSPLGERIETSENQRLVFKESNLFSAVAQYKLFHQIDQNC